MLSFLAQRTGDLVEKPAQRLSSSSRPTLKPEEVHGAHGPSTGGRADPAQELKRGARIGRQRCVSDFREWDTAQTCPHRVSQDHKKIGRLGVVFRSKGLSSLGFDQDFDWDDRKYFDSALPASSIIMLHITEVTKGSLDLSVGGEMFLTIVNIVILPIRSIPCHVNISTARFVEVEYNRSGPRHLRRGDRAMATRTCCTSMTI